MFSYNRAALKNNVGNPDAAFRTLHEKESSWSGAFYLGVGEGREFLFEAILTNFEREHNS